MGHIHSIENNIMQICFENKGKVAIPNNFFNSSSFKFILHDIEKGNPTSYKNISIPIFPIEGDCYVRIFTPSMESIYKKGNKVAKVKHVVVTSRLLS